MKKLLAAVALSAASLIPLAVTADAGPIITNEGACTWRWVAIGSARGLWVHQCR